RSSPADPSTFYHQGVPPMRTVVRHVRIAALVAVAGLAVFTLIPLAVRALAPALSGPPVPIRTEVVYKISEDGSRVERHAIHVYEDGKVGVGGKTEYRPGDERTWRVKMYVRSDGTYGYGTPEERK